MSSCPPAATAFSLSSGLRGFEKDAFGCRVRAVADTAEGERALSRCVFPSLKQLDDLCPFPDIVLRIEQVDNLFRLLVDDSFKAAATSLTSLEPQIVRALDDVIVERLQHWRAIHAGVVAWAGGAILLPGSTHAGKSTLVAELVKLGAMYFSDEYALIDADGWVHPYPRPMLLRHGGPQAVVTSVDRVGTARAPVRWILALNYEPDRMWDTKPVNQGEAMMLLLRNTPHILADTPGLIDYFGQATSGARSLIGFRPEASLAATEILRLVS